MDSSFFLKYNLFMDLIFYLTILCFIFVMGSLDNNIDFDFWARLIVGKSFFQTGTLFNNDFLSFGSRHEFIDHEWGSSLIFYLIQSNFSDFGLFLFKSIIIFLTVFVIVKIIRLKVSNIKLHFLFFFFILQSISYNIFSTIRCQSFSFFFFALYLYILLKVRKEKNFRLLWTLPILNVLWANCHGGYAIGLVLILIFAFGEALNKQKDFKYYILAFLITCITTLVNPYGIKYIYFIFEALSLNRTYITEWQSAFFSSKALHSFLKFKLFFYPCILLFGISILKNIKSIGVVEFYKKIDKVKYLILLFTLLIALKSLRFHVFFSYSVLALCYCDFYEIFNKKLPEFVDNIKEILIFILVLISCISTLYSYKFLNTVYEKEYPIYCTEFIKINNLKGNLLANFHLGSYLSYKLYPDIYIFMDGRYEEVYDINLINKMAKCFLVLDSGDFLENNQVDLIIIDKFYPLYEKLKKDKTRFLAFEDNNFALFLNLKDKKKIYKQPTQDKNYYNNHKFETRIDWR